MPKIKLTKTALDAAIPQERDYELRDTTIPGFLVKITPTGRKIFMIAYVAHNGQRRKPAIGVTARSPVEQARNIAKDWLAEVRRGADPSAERTAARQALTVKELFDRFITDYSESRNKPATVAANRAYGKSYIIPILGHLKVPDVTRADISHLMKRWPRARPTPTGCCRRSARCST
jgi:hypothetical protein